MNRKNIALIFVVIAIVASIYVLNSMKAIPSKIAQTDDEQIVLQEEAVQLDDPKLDTATQKIIDKKSKQFTKAPELAGIAGHINTEPDISIAGLKGQVILVDFWTYTCINCIRTFPYLNQWHDKYSEQGLTIVGVHTPEFDFEKDYNNVKSAVDNHEIKYAVVQDNNYRTWRAYKNRYWPRKYLIDIDGFIVYDHIGEGAYEQTEAKIQQLLKERMERLGQEIELSEIEKPEGAVEVQQGRVQTPEIYFGYKFTRGNFGNKEGFKPEEIVEYKIPAKVEANKAYIEGSWKNLQDGMELVSDTGRIFLPFSAKVVNIVAGSDQEAKVKISVDLQDLNDDNKGKDTENSVSVVKDHDLYNLVDGQYGDYLLVLNINNTGFRIFTFTFG